MHAQTHFMYYSLREIKLYAFCIGHNIDQLFSSEILILRRLRVDKRLDTLLIIGLSDPGFRDYIRSTLFQQHLKCVTSKHIVS
jgi:hypothetical protein